MIVFSTDKKIINLMNSVLALPSASVNWILSILAAVGLHLQD